MTNEMAMEALEWITKTLNERKEEADVEKENDEFSDGRSAAYAEMVDIINSRLEVLGINATK